MTTPIYDVEILKKHGKEINHHLSLTGTGPSNKITFGEGILPSGLTDPSGHNFGNNQYEPFLNVIGIEINQCQIPYMDYTIESWRNKFSISVLGGAAQDVTLLEGSYTVDELCTHIAERIAADVTGLTGVDCSNNINTSKIYLHSGSDDFDLIVSNSSLAEVLGATTSTYNATGSTTYPTIGGTSLNRLIVFDYPYNLTPDTIISIKSPELDTLFNRGRHSEAHMVTLGEQFVRNNDLVDFNYPYNAIKTFFPISSLSTIHINFIRKVEKTNYDFKGRKWYMQLLVKCVEISQEHKIEIDNIIRQKKTTQSLPRASNYDLFDYTSFS